MSENSLIKKRSRTKNFSETEKLLLIELIKPFKHIIENIRVSNKLVYKT